MWISITLIFVVVIILLFFSGAEKISREYDEIMRRELDRKQNP